MSKIQKLKKLNKQLKESNKSLRSLASILSDCSDEIFNELKVGLGNKQKLIDNQARISEALANKLLYPFYFRDFKRLANPHEIVEGREA